MFPEFPQDAQPAEGSTGAATAVSHSCLGIVRPMASMYAYPRVPRCDPAFIPLPDCMYKMQPLVVAPPQISEHVAATPESGDERSLRQVLSAQERLLARIQKIEDGFVELMGARPTSGKREAGKISVKGDAKRQKVESATASPADGQDAVFSILKRQEALIQQIDQLSEAITKSVTVSSPPKVAASANTAPITKQKATDVSVFVESGSSIDALLTFFRWLRQQKKFNVLLKTHFHSSTLGSQPSISWQDFDSQELHWRTQYDLTVTLIVTKNPTSGPQIRAFIDPERGLVSGEQEIIRAVAGKVQVEYKA